MEWVSMGALLGLLAEISAVLEGLREDLPAWHSLIVVILSLGASFGFRPWVLLHGGVAPGAEEAVLAHGVEVVHRCRDEDLACSFVDFFGSEHP